MGRKVDIQGGYLDGQRSNEQTKGQKERINTGRKVGEMDGREKGGKDKQVNRQRLDGWTDGWKEVKNKSWMDGRMDKGEKE